MIDLKTCTTNEGLKAMGYTKRGDDLAKDVLNAAGEIAFHGNAGEVHAWLVEEQGRRAKKIDKAVAALGYAIHRPEHEDRVDVLDGPGGSVLFSGSEGDAHSWLFGTVVAKVCGEGHPKETP